MGGKYAHRGEGTVKKYFSYIKIILIVCLLVFIFVDVGSDKTSNVDIDTVAVQVAKVVGMDKENIAEERMLKRFYGLNPKDYEGAVLFVPKDNMDVHEILIVKLRDESQAESVEIAIQKRLDSQLKSFEGYGAEQVALLKSHVLDVKGNYIFYMVGEKANDAEKAFLESL